MTAYERGTAPQGAEGCIDNANPFFVSQEAFDDEEAATQRSILQELHTISEEIIDSQTGLIKHGSSAFQQHQNEERPAKQGKHTDAEVSAEDSVPESKSLLAFDAAEPNVQRRMHAPADSLKIILSSQVGITATEPVTLADFAPTVSEGPEREVPTTSTLPLDGLSGTGQPIFQPLEPPPQVMPRLVAIEEAAAAEIHPEAEMDADDVDHAMLFADLDDDAFADVELSPPTQRTLPLPSFPMALSQQPSSGRPRPTRRVSITRELAYDDDSNMFFPAPNRPEQYSSFLNPQFMGFTTLKGNSVKISDKGLEAARRLLNDLDQPDAPIKASQSSLAMVEPSSQSRGHVPAFVPPLKDMTIKPLQTPSAEPVTQMPRTPLREIPVPQGASPGSSSGSPANKTSPASLSRSAELTLGSPSLNSAHPGTSGNNGISTNSFNFRPTTNTPRAAQSAAGLSHIDSPARNSPSVATGPCTPRLSTPQPLKRVALGMTPRTERGSMSRKRTLPRFITPFKGGKRPKTEECDPQQSAYVHRGDSSLPVSPEQRPGAPRMASAPVASTSFLLSSRSPVKFSSAFSVVGASIDQAVFDLQPQKKRRKLADLGRPEANSAMQAVARGAPDETLVILQNAKQAAYYAFEGPGGELLDQQKALDAMSARGCTDVSVAWVKNHWSLILWKLAAHARLAPAELAARFCWDELIKQLLYRYEREHNRAQRSCIKRIQEHDSSAARPMILFVSSIEEEQEEVELPSGSVGLVKSTHLELSDGWYRIQALVDGVLASACSRGRIKVGQKLAVMGAKLEDSGEGHEVLSAYHMTRLRLSANSVSLARWDARLGFSMYPFVASLRSLTPDGGSIAMMDIMIEKVFPTAFLDVERTSNQSSAPRGQDEEAEAQNAWLRAREEAEQRVSMQYESHTSKLAELVDSICALTSDSFIPSFPEDVGGRLEKEAGDLFDKLLTHTSPASAVSQYVLRQNKTQLLPWLETMAKEAISAQNESWASRMQADIDKLCPPRKVREFRVVRFKDARLKPAPGGVNPRSSAAQNGSNGNNGSGAHRTKNLYARTVQLTVWDSGALSGSLKEGRRFQVTNLIPSSKSAWRKPDDSADIFLSTRRDTVWRRIE